MIISHKYRFVFMHVPKCAGTSIREKLLELDPEAESHWGARWDTGHQRHVDAAHMPLADLFLADRFRRLFSEYLVIAIVRNPYERFASAIDEHSRLHGSTQAMPELLAELNPTNIRYNASYAHFCPMHFFTHIGDKRIADQIHRLDTLESSIGHFCSAIGVPPTALLPLPRQNAVSPEERKKSLEKTSPAVIGLVNSIYGRDFELFQFQTIDPAEEWRPADSKNWRDLEGRPDGAAAALASSLSATLEENDTLRSRLAASEPVAESRNRIVAHPIFGPLLRLWKRLVNPDLPI